MSTRAMINEFMAQKKLALVRLSRTTPVSGVNIDKEFRAKGYEISLVYLDEEESGATLSALKEPVGGVIIAVPAGKSEKAARQAIQAKIPRVWLQQGCESEAAIKLFAENGVPAIYNECVMMFAEPVRSFHKFHRWVWKRLGKLPA